MYNYFKFYVIICVLIFMSCVVSAENKKDDFSYIKHQGYTHRSLRKKLAQHKKKDLNKKTSTNY